MIQYSGYDLNTHLFAHYSESSFFDHLPFLKGILAFWHPGLGSHLMRERLASYSNEGLVAPALFKSYAADRGRVSVIGVKE